MKNNFFQHCKWYLVVLFMLTLFSSHAWAADTETKESISWFAENWDKVVELLIAFVAGFGSGNMYTIYRINKSKKNNLSAKDHSKIYQVNQGDNSSANIDNSKGSNNTTNNSTDNSNYNDNVTTMTNYVYINSFNVQNK